MKCSLGIFNFLEEISSLPHSVVFLCLFALIIVEGFLISPYYSLELCIKTSLSLFTFMHWRRKWQPTPVFLNGESQGRVSLVGCRLWGYTESDTTLLVDLVDGHAECVPPDASQTAA